jgi:glycerol-3-phosphate acyltransferase PlsX
MNGGIVGICDSGANVDILPDQLLDFAIMGSRYLENVYGISSPRVAMLNVGTETEKGDNLRKEAYPILASSKEINFVGNMESRDLLSGNTTLSCATVFRETSLSKRRRAQRSNCSKNSKKTYTQSSSIRSARR